jgi:hypothetical protein
LRSRADGTFACVARTTLAVACLAASLAATPVRAQGAAAPQVARQRADLATVEAAASAVRADTDLGGIRTMRTWRFKKQDSAERVSPDPFWLDFARWLAEGGRGLVWLLGAAAVVAAIVTARRWLAIHGDAIRAGGARLPPSHVRELDIRPGNAARRHRRRRARALGRRRAARRAVAALSRHAVAARPFVSGRHRRREHRRRLHPPRARRTAGRARRLRREADRRVAARGLRRPAARERARPSPLRRLRPHAARARERTGSERR